MTAVGITENVKGDVKKFEIWYSGREEVYVVQVRSLHSMTVAYDGKKLIVCFRKLKYFYRLSGSYSGGEDGLAQRASQNPD